MEKVTFKPWVWVVVLVGLLLIVFNVDPIGDGLKKVFGQGADRWAINIMLIALIIYAFVKKK